ncbi:hypothetical protein ACFLTD_04070 [Elusimicrobiota bacterium]
MNKKIFSILIVALIIAVPFLGMITSNGMLYKGITMLKNAFVHPTSAVLEVNGFIKGIFNEESVPLSETTQPPYKKSEKVGHFIFLLMCTMVIANEKLLILFLLPVSDENSSTISPYSKGIRMGSRTCGFSGDTALYEMEYVIPESCGEMYTGTREKVRYKSYF